MKKLIVYLLTVVFVFSVNIPVVYPAQGANMTVKVDYAENVINVGYDSNLNYDCYVTFYMVKSSDSESMYFPKEIFRMKEVSCKSKQSVAVQIKCGDDLDGRYDIFAIPNGKNREEGIAKTTISIVAEGSIAGILENINKADKTTIANVIYNSLAEALEFKEDSCPDWKNEYLFAMKNEDKNGLFSEFSQIKDAWADADLILALQQASSVPDVKFIIEDTGTKLGLDIKNSDYVFYNETFIENYIENLDITQPKSVSATVREFNKAAAVTAFNKRNAEDKAKAIDEYWDILNLDTIKEDVNKATSAKIARNLDGFYPDTIEDIYEKIKKETDQINNTKDVITDIRNESPKGSGGGGGGGFSNAVTIPADAFQTNNNIGFKDVDNNYWAKQYIENLVSMKVVNGYEDGTFRGENIVSREEFIKMVVSAFGLKSDVKINFKDVTDDFWASDSIRTSVGCGIINGISSTEFGVGQAITRQDMAVIIDRTLAYLGKSLSNGKTEFADNLQISDYAVESVARLSNAGIINGFADGSFKPGVQLTRAQATKVISMALDVR